MTTKQLIDELTYSCYRYNRMRSPHLSVEGWCIIFKDVNALEQRFQQELTDGKALA